MTEGSRNFNAESMRSYGASWTAAGFAGQGNVVGLIDSLAGRTIIVCGNGEGVFQELDDVYSRAERPIVFAVNDVGVYLQIVDHWFSLHPSKLLGWINSRERAKNLPAIVHSISMLPEIQFNWDKLTPTFALGGYFGMQCAWIMGAESIILCGCPSTRAKRFFDASVVTEFDPDGVNNQIVEWMRFHPNFKAAVRSQSGWTKEYFGAF